MVRELHGVHYEYARMAADERVEMLCVGTELNL